MNENVALTTNPCSAPRLSRTRFLGRQAIFDLNRNLYGHELLFRSSERNAFSGDPEFATRQVIDNYLLMPSESLGICFVNCTRRALLSGIVTLLPPSTTVLEILEDVCADPELLACCHALRAQGYRFALDDFSPDGVSAGFCEVADFIKIDFRVSDPEARRVIYDLVDRSHQICIAEKVETMEEVEQARAEGSELFQGYALSRPFVSEVMMIQQNDQTCLLLLSLLSREQIDIFQIAEMTRSDVTLCNRLLKFANSRFRQSSPPITSVEAALREIGIYGLRTLLHLITQDVLEGAARCSVVGVPSLGVAPLLGKEYSDPLLFM